MSISQILALIAQAFIVFETDQAILETGQPVLSPFVQVGTVGGKPLFGAVCASTNKNVTVSVS